MTASRKTGRPNKGQAPQIPYDELDRLLVFGELVERDDGQGATVHFPSYRSLARRFGVAHSLIARYAKKHDCLRRREEAAARIAAKADLRLIAMRSETVALSNHDALRIIDSYLTSFEKALDEGRVRFDNPADFNTMLRLKEFIQGNADSRQEIHGALSLQDIQARHRRTMAMLDETPASARGEVPRKNGLAFGKSEQTRVRKFPLFGSQGTPREMHGAPPGDLRADDPGFAHMPPGPGRRAVLTPRGAASPTDEITEPARASPAPVRATGREHRDAARSSAGRAENPDAARSAPHATQCASTEDPS